MANSSRPTATFCCGARFRSTAFAQYWHYRGHAVQDRIGRYWNMMVCIGCSDAGNICAAGTIKSPKVEDPAADYLWPAPQSSGASAPAESNAGLARRPSLPAFLVQRPLIACRAVRDLPQLGSIPARIARSEFPASANDRHVCNTQSRSDGQPASANFPAMIRPRRARPGPAHPSTLMAVQAVSVATYRR